MAVWLVRAGEHGERQDLALEHGLVVVGWAELPDLARIGSREELEALYRKAYPDAKPKKALNHVAQLWAFAKTIQKGDLVVLPLKGRGTIAFGRVQGDYAYRADLPADAHHTRPVEWLRKDEPRSGIDQDLLYSFGAFLTVCQIRRNNAEARIESLVAGRRKAKAAAPPAEEDLLDETSAQDPDRIARDQIIQHINANFKGHALTRLVAGILQAQGYDVEVSDEGADEGVDILAGRGHMGFEGPRLGVEVKSGDTPAGREILDKLRGALHTFGAEQGLVVSWSGFKQSVDKRKHFFDLRLWDQDDLLNALFKDYEKLPKHLQAEIPLKRMWALVDSDAST